MDFMEDLKDLRRTVERHSDRLANLEKSASNDHETLKAVKKDVDEMKSEITTVKNDVKAIKAQGLQTSNDLNKLTKWVRVAVCIAVVAVAYSIVRNESVASGISALTATIAKLVI